MNLSALRKRAEPMIEAPQPRQYHPKVAEMFDVVARTSDERDQLVEDNKVLKDRNAELQRENAFLETKLRQVENNRDFYQRHYIALHTRLSDIGVNIETAIREAAIEANSTGMTPEPAKVDAVEAVDEAING